MPWIYRGLGDFAHRHSQTCPQAVWISDLSQCGRAVSTAVQVSHEDGLANDACHLPAPARLVTMPTHAARLLQVALPLPLPRLFDYLPPPGHGISEADIGRRVRVPR